MYLVCMYCMYVCMYVHPSGYYITSPTSVMWYGQGGGGRLSISEESPARVEIDSLWLCDSRDAINPSTSCIVRRVLLTGCLVCSVCRYAQIGELR
jgi:hypothetical protein